MLLAVRDVLFSLLTSKLVNSNLSNVDQMCYVVTRKEYYVQCTKNQFLKLIRETSQLDLDRCLTSSITQFIGYFKYRIIDAYNPVCNIKNVLSVLDLNILTIYK